MKPSFQVSLPARTQKHGVKSLNLQKHIHPNVLPDPRPSIRRGPCRECRGWAHEEQARGPTCSVYGHRRLPITPQTPESLKPSYVQSCRLHTLMNPKIPQIAETCAQPTRIAARSLEPTLWGLHEGSSYFLSRLGGSFWQGFWQILAFWKLPKSHSKNL